MTVDVQRALAPPMGPATVGAAVGSADDDGVASEVLAAAGDDAEPRSPLFWATKSRLD